MAPTIITPSRRLIVGPRGFRKPARPVLDLTDPINKNCAGCWVFGYNAAGKVLDLFGPLNGTINGTASLVSAPKNGGLALSTGAASATTFIATGGTKLDPPAAISFWCTRLGDTASAHLAFDTDSIKINQYNGTQQVGITIPNGGTDSASGYSAPIGVETHLVFQSNGTDTLLYVNGVLNHTFTGSVLHIPRGTFGAQNSNDRGNASYTIARARKGLWTAAEIARLYAEPYAGIYEAGPRWRVGVAAAGGATRPVKMVGRWGGYAGASGGFAG